MISQRLRGVSEEGDALEADFVPKLKKAFGDVGISIEDQNGELKSTYDILDELAAKWDTLSSKQRQFLGEKAAGNRQVKTLNAIMQNWDVVQDTIQKASEAEGTATEGNELYMNSIQGRITQLKSAFQELAIATIDSDLSKFFVSLATGAVKATTAVGGLVPVAMTLGSVLASLSGAKLITSFTKMRKEIALLTSSTKMFVGTLGSVSAIIAAIGVGLMAGNAIVSLLKSLDVLPKKYSDLQDASAKAQEEYTREKNKLEELNEELKKTQDAIAVLSGKGNTLTVVEKDELDKLKQTNEQLERQIKLQRIKANIAEKSARDAAIDQFEGLEVDQFSSHFTRNKDTIDAAKKVEKLNKTVYDEIQTKILSELGVNGPATDMANLLGMSYYMDQGYDKQYKDAVQQAYTSIGFYKNSLDEAQIALDSLLNNSIDVASTMQKDEYKTAVAVRDYWAEMYNERLSILVGYQDQMESTLGQYERIENPANDRERAFNYRKEEYDYINDLLLGLEDTSFANASSYIFSKYPQQISELKEKITSLGDITAEDLGASQYEKMIEEFEKYGYSVDQVVQHMNEAFGNSQIVNTGFADVSEIISGMFQNTEFYEKTFSKMLTELEKTGTLSSSSVSTLMQQFPDMSQYLQLTANGYTMTTESLYKFIDAQNEETKQNAVEGIMGRQVAIEKLTKANEELMSSGDKLSDIDKSLYESNLESIKGYESEIEQLKAVWLEANSAADALERYRTASKTANQDAEHTEGQGILKSVQEAWKSGKVGTDDFKFGMDYLLGDGWETKFEGDLSKAYQAADKVGQKYFGKDDKTNAENFAKELANKGFATYDAKTGELEMLHGSLTEIADAFGISEAAAESLFGLINSFSFGKQITFDKEVTSSEEYAAALKAVEKATEERKAAEEELARVQKETPKDTEAIEAAAKNYNELSAKEEEAKKNAELLNQTLEESGEVDYQQLTLQDAIDKLTELQGLVNWMNKNGITVPAEIKDETGKLESWIGFLNGIEEKGENGEGYQVNVEAGVTGAEETEEKIEGVQEKTDGLNGVTGEVTADVNKTQFDEKIGDADASLSDFDSQPPAKAELDGDKDNLDDVVSEAKDDITGLVDGEDNNGNLITFDATDNGSINKVDDDADAITKKTRTINYTTKVEGLPDTVFPNDLTEDQIKAYQERVGNPTAIPMILSDDPILDQVTDGDSLKVTIADSELPPLPEKYQKEIDNYKNIALESGNANWFRRNGYVDLNNRPKVPANVVRAKGYEANDGDISTILGTTGRIGEKGEIGVVLTPILPNGEVLEPGEVDKILENLYFEDGEVKLSEAIDDVDLHDVLVSAFDLSNIPENYWDSYLEQFAKALHEVHEKMFTDVEEPVEIEAEANIDESSIKTPEEPVQFEVEWTGDSDVEDIIENAQDVADANPIELSFTDLINAHTGQFDLVTQAIGAGVGDTSEGIESIQSLVSAYDDLESAQQKVADAKVSGNEEEINQASSELVTASRNFMSAYRTLSAKVNAIQTVKVTANVQQALNKINALSETTVTVNVDANTNTNTGAKKFPFFATGTRNAKRGLSLVDDGNGAELIEHKKDGTFELGTDNGPRLTTLDKGDVVHTAEDTKKILARTGGIGKFFKNGINKSKSIFGPAFGTGLNLFSTIQTGLGIVSGFINTAKKIKKDLDSGINPLNGAKIKNGSNNTGNKKNTTLNNNNNNNNNNDDQTKKFDDYIKKLFDWIEIKLDRLKDETDAWVKKAEDAIKLSRKQGYTDKAIKATEEEIDANRKGYKRYRKQAKEAARLGGLDRSITKKVRAGTIDIASYDEDTQKKIAEYQKWYEKALQCKKAVKDLTDQEKELAKQKLDNIADYYDNKLEAAETAKRKSEATRELVETTGKGTKKRGYSASIRKSYDSQIKQNDNTDKYLRKEKRGLKSERKKLMKRGLIKKGDATWNEYEQRINDIDVERIENKTDTQKLKDEKNRIQITRIGYRRDKIENRADQKTKDKEIAEARGQIGDNGLKDYYKDMITLMGKSNNTYDEEIAKLKELQKGLNPLSDKYQELEKEIQADMKAQKDNTLAIEDYKAAIRDIDYSNLEYSLELAKAASAAINDNMDIAVAQGKRLTKEDYTNAIKSNKEERKVLEGQKEFNSSEKKRLIREGKKNGVSREEVLSSKEYRDLEKEGLSIDASLRQNTLTNLSLKKSRRNVKADLLGRKIENKEAKGDRLAAKMELANARGTVKLSTIAKGNGPGGYNDQIKNLKSTNKLLSDQTDIYKSQQKGMEKYSDEWQELQNKINANTASINSNNLAIEQSKDAMVDASISIGNYKLDKISDSIDEKNDNIETKRLTGKKITEGDYNSLIKSGQEEVKVLKNQASVYEGLLKTVEVGSQKYYEYSAALRDVNAKIRDVNQSTIEWQKTASELKIQNLQWANDDLSFGVEKKEAKIDLKQAQGKAVTAADYQTLIDGSADVIKNLREQNKVLEEQRKGMDVESEEYQNITKQIRANKLEIIATEKATEEWKDSINQIKLDSLTHDFESLEDESSRIQSALSLKEINGEQISESSYNKLISIGTQQIDNLRSRKEYIESLMAGLDEDSDKYREYESQVSGLNNQIRGLKQTTAEWAKERDNLKLERLEWKGDALSAKADRKSEEISLKEASGAYVSGNDYRQQIKIAQGQKQNLLDQNEYLKSQQAGMDKNSKAWQDLQKQINSNLSSIAQLESNTVEWGKAIDQIPLDRLEHKMDKAEVTASKLKDEMDLNQILGKEITAKAYKELIRNGNSEISTLNRRKEIIQGIMDQLVKENGESAKQSKIYKEWEAEYDSIDSKIRGITKSQAEWRKEIQNLNIQKLAWEFDYVANNAEKMADAMSLHAAQGVEETAITYAALIRNGFEQIAILEEENKEYLKQQKSMDIMSDAYQDLQQKIESNNRSIAQMKVSQEQWNDSIIDLDINKLNKYKDAISKTNDQYKRQKEYQEAIQELEKANTQRTLRTYREGVGFVFEADQDAVKEAQENLQDVVQDQLMDKIDELIEALESSKEDTNVYDAKGKLLGKSYTTPQLGTLVDILSAYTAKNGAIADLSALRLGESFTLQGANNTNNRSLSLEIGGITVNDVQNGDEFARAIVEQFPNALLQALYAK